MRKLTVYGELYLEDQDWSDEWCGEVELDDENFRTFSKIMHMINIERIKWMYENFGFAAS